MNLTGSSTLSKRAFRRPAAARRARAQPRGQTGNPFARRAAVQSRRQAARADARGAEALQRRTGITFVYVTHDQAEALALSDHIAVMHGGKLQQFGTPHDVYARPANRIVADFMGLVNFIPGKVLAIHGEHRHVEAGSLSSDRADGTSVGDTVEVAIRPENIKLAPRERPPPKITERTFPRQYQRILCHPRLRPTLRVQTHPTQVFSAGDAVAVEIDSTQCSVFRNASV